MSLSLKEALLAAKECPYGGILIATGSGYEVKELPKNSVIIVPASPDAMPIGLSENYDFAIKKLLVDAVKGLLTRPPGKKIKRRV